MKNWKKGILTAVIFTASLFCITEVKAAKEDTVYEGIYIEDVDLSGMAETEVRAAVDEVLQNRLKDEVTFHMNGNTYSTTGAALGYTWTNEGVVQEVMEYGKRGNVVSRYKQKKELEQSSVSFDVMGTVDSTAVQNVLETNCVAFNQPAQDFTIKCESNKMVHVPGVPGVELDVTSSVGVVSDFMTQEWNGGAADIDLSVITVAPGGDEEMLSKVKDKFGAGSTDYSTSSKNRKTNVANAVSKIDGTILYPGESFSVLDAVLPFEEDNGYAEAASYSQGEVVESIGGGVCQVSSTLYLALIRSELQIDKRFAHSMLVAYVKPGFDAAVAEGSKDLQFTNNTDAPIYIHGTADGSTVAFTIFGLETRSENREISFKTETLSSTNEKVKTQVKLWKYVTENGETTKVAVNTSTYYKSNAEEEQEKAVRAVENLIASIGNVTLDDEGTIAAADAAYAALSSSQRNQVKNAGTLSAAKDTLYELKQQAAAEEAARQEAANQAAAEEAARQEAANQAAAEEAARQEAARQEAANQEVVE